MEEQNKKEKAKKQLLLRLSPTLWQELASWAEDDFRSINGQIEYLLTECEKAEKEFCTPCRRKRAGIREALQKPPENFLPRLLFLKSGAVFNGH